MDRLNIRPAVPEERLELEELQRRASLALETYRDQLEANPDAIDLPAEQIERGEVLVAEVDGRLAGFAAVLIANEPKHGAECQNRGCKRQHLLRVRG